MKSIYIITLSAFCLLAGACKKYVDIPLPQNKLVADLVFANDKTADAAMAGLYSEMNAYNSQFANLIANFMPAFSADEFHYAFSFGSYDEFKNNSLSPSNTYVNRFWEPVYSYIYHSNAILEGLDRSDNLSASLKDQIRGEALFMRAFCYFYLVNYFGDVPLITTTDIRVNNTMPRTPKAEVWDAIINDLKNAQQLLPDAYPGGERTRANKAVATALLARSYLYTEQWDKAETEAGKIIGNSMYKLLADLSQVFLKNSQEAIWQLQSVNTSTSGVNTWEGFGLVPVVAGGRAYYVTDNTFTDEFETGDQRLTNWVGSFVLSGVTYHYPYKYKVRTGSPVKEYSMVLRVAEQYLIRAEARAQQNKLSESLADVDSIRVRAGLDPLPNNLGKEDILLAIEKERRIELFAEWGHRWLDLKRTGRALAVLGPKKPDLTEDDLLYPIPKAAMNTNPNLVQNQGYN